MDQTAKGIVAMIAACVIWGLSPLYYKLLTHVPPLEILAHRTLWSLVTFAGLLAFQGRLRALGGALGAPRAAGITLFAALMISTNWFLFILSIQIERATEASLGYYIFPLVAVLLGVLAYGERLARLQWVAVGLAALGVTILTIGQGAAPWVSLVLALTFGLYGLVKKRLTVGPVVSVTGEVALLAPVALGWLVWFHWGGNGVFAQDLHTSALLMFSGLITALPLILFSRAAKVVRLATVGLIQYINPTLQFLCATLVFGEPFGALHAATFGLIWAALALYSAVSLGQENARRRQSMAVSAEVPTLTKSSSDGSANP